MTRRKFITVVLSGFVGLMIYFSGFSNAQSELDYKCNIKEMTKMFTKSDIFLVLCTIRKPVDETTLRDWAQQVYVDQLESKYQNISIGWMLYLESENDTYLSDIGSVRYKNGKIKELYLPEINKSGDSNEITNKFLLRLFQDITQDGFKEELLKLRQKF